MGAEIIAKQDRVGTEPEPETGTVRTILPGTEVGTGTLFPAVRTILPGTESRTVLLP